MDARNIVNYKVYIERGVLIQHQMNTLLLIADYFHPYKSIHLYLDSREHIHHFARHFHATLSLVQNEKYEYNFE
jgi:hypothetical protein